MKRFLLVLTLVVMSVCVFAQITPYGSARMGYWYDLRDEDMTGRDSELSMQYFLQSNSRLGVNYKHENFDGRIELGVGGSFSLRLLYGKQTFGDFSLLVGQDVILGTDFLANQVYDSDLNLQGWGVAWGGRQPQIRLEMNNGFYAALITPHTSNGPANHPDHSARNPLFPRINLGYKVDLGNIKLTPAAVFQYYDYKDTHIYEDGGSVMSWLGAVTGEFTLDKILLNAQANVGSNIGNMGYNVTKAADWDVEKAETLDVLTYGGLLTATFNMDSTTNFTLGFGYTANSMEDWDNTDDRMALYVQANKRLGRLRLTPEVGMLNEMKNQNDESQGMLMYFGAQLRFDF